MIKKRTARLVVWLVPIVLICWAGYQLIDLYASRSAHQDASRMLFEASSFQIELLSRFMSEASSARTSEQLDALRNAAYSASFVHDRFTRAFPPGHIAELASLNELLQAMLHLQIGGDRPLKAEEQAVLKELEPVLAELSTVYSTLMSEDGTIQRYERRMLEELDRQVISLLKPLK